MRFFEKKGRRLAFSIHDHGILFPKRKTKEKKGVFFREYVFPAA